MGIMNVRVVTDADQETVVGLMTAAEGVTSSLGDGTVLRVRDFPGLPAEHDGRIVGLLN